MLAFGTSPVAGSSLTNQVPTWWHKAQLLINSTSLPPCGTSSGNFSDGRNIDMSNEATPQSETSIAINPANPAQIVGGSNEIFCLPMRGYFSSRDGASGSWGAVDLPLPPPLSPNGKEFGSDPGVAWDALGNVYYSYIVVFWNPQFHNVTGSEMAVARSSDDGRTWTATFFNLNAGNGKFNDKPMITVDTNRSSPHFNTVYVAWDNASQRNGKSSANDVILVSSSTDHGVTFSNPVPASPNSGGPAGVIGADPFVAPDGTLYVAWQDGLNPAIRVSSSTDGGQSFGSAHLIANTLADFEVLPPAQASRGALIYPSCAAATTGSRIYCSWTDATPADGMRVFVSHSDDGGVTWSSQARVSDPGVLSDQFNQWLAVDPTTGTVVLSWNDSRNDPTRHATDIFVAKLTTTGFVTQQVTTSPTDETVAGADLGNQYGDYEFIAAFNGEIHPVWTDRRASIAAVNLLDEEVFTATVKE
jgi:hypothetical protein